MKESVLACLGHPVVVDNLQNYIFEENKSSRNWFSGFTMAELSEKKLYF